MASESIELLMRLTLASSVAVVCVLLIRQPLRRLAGAPSAWQCWLLVPIALAAAALPQLKGATVLSFAPSPGGVAGVIARALPAAVDWSHWVGVCWAVGALAALALFTLAQRRFVRSLGALTQDDGYLLSQHGTGPVLLGLRRPVIVVPSDFTRRYSAAEQALILAHERMHLARRDHLVNALVALLQCVFWFNPLIHIGAARCRFDQELACDAAVMARHAGQRQAYGAALLKTQSGGAPALATCHWQSHHPLKERIMQLNTNSPGTARRRAGRAIVTLLACVGVLTTVAVRAGESAAAPSYALAVNLGEGGGTQRLLVKEGEDMTLTLGQTSGVFRIKAATPESVYLKMNVSRQGVTVANPTLQLNLDQTGAVTIGQDVKIEVTVSRATMPAST